MRGIITPLVFVLVIFSFYLSVVLCLDNGLGRVPQMGYV